MAGFEPTATPATGLKSTGGPLERAEVFVGSIVVRPVRVIDNFETGLVVVCLVYLGGSMCRSVLLLLASLLCHQFFL